MKSLNEIVEELAKNPIINDMSKKYKNEVAISGLIIRKPKFFKHDTTGKESSSIVLYQIVQDTNQTSVYSYSVMIYIPELIEQLKTLDKVCLVAIVGAIHYSKKINGLFIKVKEMHTLIEFENELAE